MTKMAERILSETLSEAIAFAAEKHRGQTDKQGDPYILHPMRVMFTLREEGYPLYVQMAGVLHDVVEDTDATLEEIDNRFGPSTSIIVDRVTRRAVETYREYIDRLLVSKDEDAKAVKLADLKDNLRVDRFTSDAPYERMVKTLRRLKGQD